MAGEREVVVVAACIRCKATRDIRAGEVEPGDMPFCKCGSIMVAKGAATRLVKPKKGARRAR